ncbi:MAG: hypothetical protein WC695_06630 [Candidatus Omnitrophota bacterium]
MRKYRIRRIFWWAAKCVIAGIVLLTVIANLFCAAAKNSLSHNIDSYFAQDVSFGKIFYLPPGFIIITDLSISSERSGKMLPAMSVPFVRLRFSPLQLAFKRDFVVLDIKFYQPRMNYYKFYNFLRENFVQIVEFIRLLPKQDVHFSIGQARLDLDQKGSNPNYFSSTLEVSIKGDEISGRGSLSKDTDVLLLEKSRLQSRSREGVALQYRFRGRLEHAGVSFETLEVIRKDLYAKFWGKFLSHDVVLNGFAFIDTRMDEPAQRGPGAAAGSALLPVSEQFSQAVGMPQANLYLLDINCRANLVFPQLRINHLSFSINNNPCSLTGSIVLGDPIRFDLMFSSSLAHMLEDARVENFKKILLGVKGDFQNDLFCFDAQLNFDFVKKKKGSIPLEKFEAGFKGVTVNCGAHPRFAVDFKEAEFFCQTDSNTYTIQLKDFRSSLFLLNDRYLSWGFGSRFAEGALRGRASVDMGRVPAQVSATLRLRNCNAHSLDGILVHFSKVHGKLFSQMHFRSSPGMYLRGGLAIRDGYLHNFEFFKWLADFFGLSSLQKVDFSRAVSNFSIDKEGARLARINLDSRDLRVSGAFGLGMNDLVSSKLSLVFSKSLLRESPKFTPLLRLLDKDMDSLTFDFQLSGWLHGMNFKWLQSDFKRRIQNSIPNFIERSIEKNIETAIESIDKE